VTIELTFRAELRDFTIEIEKTLTKRSTAVIGPSGSGKSYILRTLAGEAVPQEGRIVISGHTIFDSKAEVQFSPETEILVGYVPSAITVCSSATTVLDYLKAHTNSTDVGDDGFLERIINCLALTPHLNSATSQLEPGYERLLRLATLMAGRPLLVLFDEPLIIFDKRRTSLIPILSEVIDELDTRLVFVSHNEYEVEALAEEVIEIDRGRVVYCSTIPRSSDASNRSWLRGSRYFGKPDGRD
jgi:ABC-type molybdate transport system ATPase subunit